MAVGGIIIVGPVEESGMNVVSKHQIIRCERGRLKEIFIFPVQLTTSRIGNLTYPVDPLSCYMYDV